MVGMALLAVAVVLQAVADHLHSYRRIPATGPVAHFHFTRQAPGDYVLRVEYVGGDEEFYDVRGEDWRLAVRTLRWNGLAARAGLPPFYRLETLATSPGEDRQLLTTDTTVLDLWGLARDLPWLPWIEAGLEQTSQFHIVDGGRFTLRFAGNGLEISMDANDEL
jgi:hypothetical protein